VTSQRGFATVLFLGTIPVLVAGGLMAFIGFSFLKADMAVLNVCRAGQLEIQDKVGRDLGKLFSLNPKALKLRAGQHLAEYKLQMAIAGGNPYAIAAAEARLLYVQTQRQALAFRQRVLIQSANMKFSLATPQITQAMLSEWKSHMLPLRSWVAGNIGLSSLKVPTLSVRPDFPDAAPAYERLPQFEEVQSWAHFWQLQVEGSLWTKHFLTFKGRFPRSCSTSLYNDTDSWVGKLKKVKSSLKPSSY
jgi:hypothetical protein